MMTAMSTAMMTAMMTAAKPGTTQPVDLETEVKVPLLGEKPEAPLEEQDRPRLEVEPGPGRAWLRGER